MNIFEVDTIDTREELEKNEAWTVQCNEGYQEDWQDFKCGGPEGIDIPPEHQNTSVGYWTQCVFPCRLTYDVTMDDYTQLGVSVYQRNRWIQICRDNQCESHSNQGWQSYFVKLENIKVSAVHLK